MVEDVPSSPRLAVAVAYVALRICSDQLCVQARRRAEEPLAGSLELPGDIARPRDGAPFDGIDEFAAQVFAEKSGLSPASARYFAQLGAYGPSAHDPRGQRLTIAYVVVVPETDDEPGDGWQTLNGVLQGYPELAFEQEQIVRLAIDGVRDALGTSALALAFCREQFTIPRLRQVYEIVWGLQRDLLDPGVFHKRIMKTPSLLGPVKDEEPRSGGQGRPAQLYTAGSSVWSSGSPLRLVRPIERPGTCGREDRLDAASGVLTSEDSWLAEVRAGSLKAPPSMDQAKWETALAKAREVIWEHGVRGELIQYGELARLLDINLRAPAFFQLLDTLCVQEDAAGGPMVTALVANKRTGMPGQRFFVLADELGREFDSLSEFVDGERIWAYEWIRAHPERGRMFEPGTESRTVAT